MSGSAGGSNPFGDLFAPERQQMSQANSSFQNERSLLQQQQQAKGIKNPSPLLDLQTKLKTGQISRQQFISQFGKASKGAKGVGLPNTPFKLTPGLIAGQTFQATKKVLPAVAQSFARTGPELVATAEQAITKKPTTLTPNKGVGQLLFGNTPVQSIQEKSKGAELSHPKGFNIGPLHLSPKATGVAETVGSLAQDVPLAAGAVKTAVKTGETAKALATGEKTISDLKIPKPSNLGLKPLNQSGSIAPGKPIKEASDLVNKYQQSNKFSGDIQRFATSSEGSKNNLLNDSAKLIKNRVQLSNDEKTQLQALRDARATKQTIPQVSDKVSQADKEATSFAKATIANDAERAKLEGNLQKAKSIMQRDPESYTHRIAQGKGSSFDYILQGDKSSPLSVGFGKTTSADKSRTMFAAVDENGNRRVISIKSQSGKTAAGQKFNKPNQIVAFDNGKATETLGNLKTKANAVGKQFKGADGKTYTIDNATADEITKNSGTKYFTDPSLTNHAAYIDSRVALENARMFDAIKKAPEAKTFMVEPGETAPKGWKSAPGVPQFQGYKFQPRAAEAITDAFGAREPAALSKASQVLRQTIVYFPLKHDFNMTAAYVMDRGASSLVNPLATGRLLKSWVQAAHDLHTKSDFYQAVANEGFGLTTNDKKAFEGVFKKELQKIAPSKVNQIAKLAKLNPVNVYKAVQRLTVWDVQDFLNLARIHERMSPTLLQRMTGNKMSLKDAVKQTEKYSFQYKVPSRVMGSRTAARGLKSPIVFFGAYKYDQYKMVFNALKGMLNITKPGEAVKNADKVAALLIGSLVAWPEVNKGIQKLTGDKNAHATAAGPLAIPETINKVRKGQQTIGQAAGNQISIGPTQQILDLKSNTDSFTGKKIADPNVSEAQQMQQRLSWLKNQLAPVQKVAGAKNAGPGKQMLTTILNLAGASTPKNSPQTNKLQSLKYDSLPNVQNQVKQAKTPGEQYRLIQQYNNKVILAAKADLRSQNKPIPSDNVLRFQLKKGGFLYAPKTVTLKNYISGKKTVRAGAFTP